MQTRWYSSRPKAEHDEIKNIVVNSQKVLDILKEICYTTIQDGVMTKD